MSKHHKSALFILTLIMAWLVLVPYYGPIYRDLVERAGLSYDTAQLVFICVYFISVILASFFIQKENLKRIIYVSTSACLLLTISGWLLPSLQSMYILHVLLGTAAAMISSAFVYIFIYGFTPATRMKATAGFQLGVSVFVLLFTHVLYETNPQYAFAASCLLLLLLLYGSVRFDADYMPLPASIPENPVPVKLILIICFVMFIAYFNVRQQVNMLEILSQSAGIDIMQDNFMMTVLEIAIYIIFLFFAYKADRFILIYSTLIFAALSYLSGIVAPDQVYVSAICYFASGCMSNLFAFTFIGDLALKYGRNFKTATFGLIGVGLGAIGGEFLGQLTSGMTGEKMTSVISVSLSTIFLSFLIIPWLAKYVHDEMLSIMDNECASLDIVRAAPADLTTTVPVNVAVGELSVEIDDLSKAAEKIKVACLMLAEGNRLTPRELEIAVLLFERYDNETIAQRLFISPNTLKVHIRRIYEKFQVSRKKEFIMAVDNLCGDIRNQREKITR